MLISVDDEKCLRDEICVEACGRRLIEMGGTDGLPTAVPEGEDLCNDCGHCVAACPTGALSRENMTPEACPEIRSELVISEDQAEQFLRSRRSIRGYQAARVERDKLEKLVAVAGYAPSARNARPVHLLVVHDPTEVRRFSGLTIDGMRAVAKEAPELAEALHLDRLIGFWDSGSDPLCRNAPHLIVAHADESATMADVDCIIALSYLELAAPSLGLGATWAGYVMAAMGLYPPLAEALHLPLGHKCYGILMLGYPQVKFVRMPLRTPPAVTWR